MKLYTSKSFQIAPLHFQNFKNFLGEGSPSPLPKPSPLFHSALRASIPRFARTRRFTPRCALRAILALRASVRVSRKLSASHAQHFHRSRKNPAYATAHDNKALPVRCMTYDFATNIRSSSYHFPYGWHFIGMFWRVKMNSLLVLHSLLDYLWSCSH